MEIIGAQIISDQCGIGTITAISETMVMTILFPEVGEKRFKYPDAFCKSIQSENINIQEEAEEAWMEKKKAEEAAKKESENGNKRNPRMHLTPGEIESMQADCNKFLKALTVMNSSRKQQIAFSSFTRVELSLKKYKGGYIWAPASGIHHHERMTGIRKGDIIVNYANGAVQAVSEALCDCFYSPRPSELDGNDWDKAGYRVQVRYQKLSNPIRLDDIQDDIKN